MLTASKKLYLNPILRSFLFYFYRTKLGTVGKETIIHPLANLLGMKKNIYLGEKVRIGSHATLEVDDKKSSIIIGDNSYICANAMLLTQRGSIKIGSNCSVNPFSILYGLGGLWIGDCVRIACHTTIIPANHIFEDIDIPIHRQGLSKKGVVIEDDVWIGAKATILDGCTIGMGSVIGAGAVVVQDVPAYSVVVGVPGKVIKSRK